MWDSYSPGEQAGLMIIAPFVVVAFCCGPFIKFARGEKEPNNGQDDLDNVRRAHNATVTVCCC